MKKNGMRVTSLFLAAVMLASAPVTASAADTSANVEGEVVVDQTSQDQTSAESQNQAGQDQTSAEAQDQPQASAAEDAAGYPSALRKGRRDLRSPLSEALSCGAGRTR